MTAIFKQKHPLNPHPLYTLTNKRIYILSTARYRRQNMSSIDAAVSMSARFIGQIEWCDGGDRLILDSIPFPTSGLCGCSQGFEK